MSEAAKIISVLEKANGQRLNLDAIFAGHGFASKEELAKDLAHLISKTDLLCRTEGPGGRLVYWLNPNAKQTDLDGADLERAPKAEAPPRPVPEKPQQRITAEQKMKTATAPKTDTPRPVESVPDIDDAVRDSEVSKWVVPKDLLPPASRSINYAEVIADLEDKRTLVDNAIRAVKALAGVAA